MQHKWLLSFENHIPDQLRKLSSKDRIAVFRSVAELLLAENPTAVPGVKKLVEKCFEEMLRQRQGDYRIFFRLEPGTVEEQGQTYKG